MNLPSDFIDKMKKKLGQEWEPFLACYEHDKYQALRINALKKNPDINASGRVRMLFDALEQVPWEKHGFYYKEEARPGKHAYHEAGIYYIQEPSAMSAAALLAPQPGMRVLDLCAAPGGKTTQIASYLGQQGLLIANEIHPARAKILAQNVERMGIANAIVTNEESGHLADKIGCFFHAILVDAPCSGEGMFRKNPEAMEEWSLAQVDVCAARQREILDNAAKMLLPGGKLVYSTCTFSEEENEQTIASFLDSHPEFAIADADAPWFEKTEQGTFRLWPHKLHGEGHFVAVLKKAGCLPTYAHNDEASSRKKQKPILDKEKEKALSEFLDNAIGKEQKTYILQGNLVLFGDQLYRLPEEAIDMKGLKVLRAGLHIGEFKKNRFEPSHALALYLGKDEVMNWVSFSCEDLRVNGYLRGESLFLNEADQDVSSTSGKGWCLVCVDGYSIGWGKLAGGQIKNHYPKGLRREVN